MNDFIAEVIEIQKGLFRKVIFFTWRLILHKKTIPNTRTIAEGDRHDWSPWTVSPFVGGRKEIHVTVMCLTADIAHFLDY